MPPHEWPKGLPTWIDWLNRESPRGKVLISCGYIEELLKEVIAAFLIRGKPKDDLLGGGSAPLGSLWARTRMCFCLGLLSEQEYHDLEIIRGIRNDFAHQVDTTFEMQSIKDRCANLKLKMPNAPDGATQWVSAAAVLIINLGQRAQDLKGKNVLVPLQHTTEWKSA